MPDPNYQIVKVQMPILNTAGHNFIVLKDSAGNVVSEYHGLAEDKNGEVEAIGYRPSDNLRFHSDVPLYKSTYSQVVLFEGSEQETQAKWTTGYEAGLAINEKDLGYPILGVGPGFGDDESRWGINSNSTASTLIAAMGLEEVDVPNDKLTPGEGKLILSEEELQKIINPQPTPADSAPPTEPTPATSETSSAVSDQTNAYVLGGSKQAQLMAISNGPSFNYTSHKKDSVAGYTLTQAMDNATNTASHTFFNGTPAYLLTQTTQPTCQGDASGRGGGVKSGSIGKEVKPTSGSSTVFIAGKALVREGDSCIMNNGNVTGTYTLA